MYVVQVTADSADQLDLDNLQLMQASIVYDINESEYDYYSSTSNRIWAELSEMPEYLQEAVIAIEDKNFYNEPGVNWTRTIGAVLNELTNNRIYGSQQGASTIEQQLIKNLTEDNGNSYMRKVREIFRALGLANRYSKETVLEAYLNTIPLTGQIYGMAAGAREYFGKEVSELSLSECAVLASITKSPTAYNPFTNPENLIARRNNVLWNMYDQGYITEDEYNSACAESITVTETSTKTENAAVASNHSYFSDALFNQLTTDIMETYGVDQATAQQTIYTGGLSIYSTVDPKVQTAIENLMMNDTNPATGKELFPALAHNEEINTSIPADSTYETDENGLPLNPDGSAVFGEDDTPVYTDDTNTAFKTSTDDSGNLIFYRSVRTQAAIAVVDFDGQVLGIGGGLGEKKYDLGTNRATLPHQTGSTMKPIAAYCLGIDNNLITYSTALSDEPLYNKQNKLMLDTEYCLQHGLSLDPTAESNLNRSDVWKVWPTNFDDAGGKGAPMLIVDAIRKSYNTIAVKVGDMVGVDYMYNFLTDTLQLQYLDETEDLNLAPLVLGSQYQGLTMVELAGAYTMFNDGSYTTPHYYTTVYDSSGNVYLDNSKKIATVQAIKSSSATIMNRLLANVWNGGSTASGMKPQTDTNLDAIGKTGTTSDFKDFTFAGVTPYYSVAIWWGYDKPSSMYDVWRGVDGKPTQYAFKYLMEELEADLPAKDFYFDENVKALQYNSSGTIVSSGGSTGYYTEDNLPEDISSQLTEADLAAMATTDPAA